MSTDIKFNIKILSPGSAKLKFIAPTSINTGSVNSISYFKLHCLKAPAYLLRRLFIIIIIYLTLPPQINFSQDRQYWDQAIGGRAALLGGLVVGGIRDYSATWYNPGALGFLEKDHLNFSFSSYGIKYFAFKHGSGLDPDPSYTRVSLYPTSLAGGIPFLSDSTNRFSYIILGNGYSYVRTSARYEGYLDVIPSRPCSNTINQEVFVGNEFLINQGIFHSSLQEVTFGLGWGRKISDNISIGATLLGAYRNQTKLRDEKYYALDTLSQKMTSSSIYSDIDYYAIRVFGKIGIAAEWDDIKLGAAITLPSIHVHSGAIDGASFTSTNYIAVVDSVSGAINELDVLGSDRQEDLMAKYRSTFSVAFGLEYDLTQNTKLNFTSEWFSPLKRYVVIQPKSDNFFRNLPLEVSFFNSEEYLKVYDSYRSVINFGLAVEHKISDIFTGYAAVRTDFSNAVFEDINGFHLGFTDIDIYHITVGASTIIDNSFIGVGVEYSFGNNPDFEQIFNFPSGTASFDEFFLIRDKLNAEAVYKNINVFLGITQLLGD